VRVSGSPFNFARSYGTARGKATHDSSFLTFFIGTFLFSGLDFSTGFVSTLTSSTIASSFTVFARAAAVGFLGLGAAFFVSIKSSSSSSSSEPAILGFLVFARALAARALPLPFPAEAEPAWAWASRSRTSCDGEIDDDDERQRWDLVQNEFGS
jgi:hypothetical protein